MENMKLNKEIKKNKTNKQHFLFHRNPMMFHHRQPFSGKTVETVEQTALSLLSQSQSDRWVGSTVLQSKSTTAPVQISISSQAEGKNLQLFSNFCLFLVHLIAYFLWQKIICIHNEDGLLWMRNDHILIHLCKHTSFLSFLLIKVTFLTAPVCQPSLWHRNYYYTDLLPGY